MSYERTYTNNRTGNRYILRYIAGQDGHSGHIRGVYQSSDGRIIANNKFNFCSCWIGPSDIEEDRIEFHTGDIQVNPEQEGLGSLMMIFGLTLARQRENASRFYVTSAVNPAWQYVFTPETTEGLPYPPNNGEYYADLDAMLTRLIRSAQHKGWQL